MKHFYRDRIVCLFLEGLSYKEISKILQSFREDFCSDLESLEYGKKHIESIGGKLKIINKENHQSLLCGGDCRSDIWNFPTKEYVKRVLRDVFDQMLIEPCNFSKGWRGKNKLNIHGRYALLKLFEHEIEKLQTNSYENMKKLFKLEH